MSQPQSIQAHFSVLPDPRIDRRRRHKLLDILVISLCAAVVYTNFCKFPLSRGEGVKA